MRVAHRKAGDFIDAARHLCLSSDHLLLRQIYRYFCAFQAGRAHIYPCALYLSVILQQPYGLDAAERFNRHFQLVDNALVMQVFGHAPDGVPAHFALAAVPVEHAHLRIRHLRRANQHHAVSADADMAVCQLHAQPRRVADGLVKTVEIDIVVAAALHFHKFQRLLLAAQVVDVHQFCASLGIPALQAVQKGAGRIHGRKAWDIALYGFAADPYAVPSGDAPFAGSGDHILDLAAFQQR